MLSRTASLLSKRAGHSISSAVSKQLAPAVMASSAGSVSAAANPSLSSGRQYTTHSQLPEEHQMIYEMCRNFANEELAPNAGEWDQKHAFPTEAITHMVRNDIQRSARGWPQSFIYVITLFTLKEGHARIHAFYLYLPSWVYCIMHPFWLPRTHLISSSSLKCR